jgi:hypothetical protein
MGRTRCLFVEVVKAGQEIHSEKIAQGRRSKIYVDPRYMYVPNSFSMFSTFFVLKLISISKNGSRYVVSLSLYEEGEGGVEEFSSRKGRQLRP